MRGSFSGPVVYSIFGRDEEEEDDDLDVSEERPLPEREEDDEP